MLRKLDKKNPTPLYQQIKQSIIEAIDGGEWHADEQIPTELELEEFFGASRTTIRQAIIELIDERYLYRKRGVGTFVVDSAERKRSASKWAVTMNVSELIQINALSSSRKILSLSSFEANDELAARLMVQNGSEVFRLERVQLGDGVPLSYMMSFVNPRFVRTFLQDRERIEDGLHNYFAACGHPIYSVDYEITATSVNDEKILSELDIEPGSAHLFVRNRSKLQDGSIIEVAYTIINSSRVSIPATFRYR